ncbi:MAG: TetR/AcrR family transcriptional regulator [Solirubrobacterales bacterium]
MSKRPTAEEEAAARLARLPPGRHGLSREFVTQNQRDRLVAGMIAAIAEKGYRDATVTDISAAAGVSRRTFYGYFSSKEDCYLATYEVVARHLAETSRAAGKGQRSWARRVRAEIGGAMEFFSGNPDLVRFYLQAPPRAGEGIAARYRRGAERVLAQLADGVPAKAKKPNPDVLNAISGGMAALIVRKVEAGEGDRLAELVPDLTEIFLTPFLGRAEASRLARGD